LCHTNDPEAIEMPTMEEVITHLALVKQQCLDRYSAIIEHATKQKQVFDAKLLKWVPKNIVFKAGDLVQTHKLAHLQLSRN
jgi:hypothetical protein